MVYKKNNIGHNSVNVDISYFKISKIFDSINNTNILTVIDNLRKERKSLYVLWKFYGRNENDKRSGQETYGYDNIKNDLIYISDRFSCQFRIRWLIDLLAINYYVKILNQEDK